MLVVLMADQHGVTRKSKLSIKTINRQVKALELSDIVKPLHNKCQNNY